MLQIKSCACRHPSSHLASLHCLAPGERGVVRKIEGCGAERSRLLALGFVAGKTVEVLRNAQGPMVVLLDTGRICLCRSQARHILVEIQKAHP